jgi:hypothetical protein
VEFAAAVSKLPRIEKQAGGVQAHRSSPERLLLELQKRGQPLLHIVRFVPALFINSVK